MINKRLLCLGLIVVAALTAALLFRSGALACLTLPFMAYAGLGLLRAPTEEEISLSASRSFGEIRRGPTSSIELRLSIRNAGPRTVRVLFSDPLMSGMRIVEGSLGLHACLRAGEEAELRYVFEATRGVFSWDELPVKVSDPFGLVEIETRIAARARIVVQPWVRKMPSIAPRLRKTLSSPGSIPIRLGGNGTDFWGIREYRQGDPLKRLYWRLNARDPLRRYTKEFIQERTAEIILILDGRQRMDLAVGDSSIFEREIEALASLAGMFLRQGQRVGLFIIGTSLRNILPGYGKMQLRRILDCLAEAEPEGEGARDSLRILPALRYSRSAFMLVMSPLARGDEYIFQRLRALGYAALLVSPDTLDFARPAIAADAMTDLALKTSGIERKLALDQIAGLSFAVVDWRLDSNLAPLLKRALARRAIG